MKKSLILCAVLAVTGVNAFAINENVIVWEEIYGQMDTNAQKYSVMLKIMEFKDREFTPMIQGALDGLIASQLALGSAAERHDKIELAKLLVTELGNLKSVEAAESVFATYTDTADAILKAAAATSLGMMRATQYAEQLAFDLAAINVGPVASKSHEQEIIALGLVKGLDAMRASAGYEPVFLASFGWYSARSQVREAAQAAATTMVDDPTESLYSVFDGNPDPEIKLAAVQAEGASKADAAKKAEFNRHALLWGHDRVEKDPILIRAVQKVRMAAINALIEMEDKSTESVPLLIRSFEADKKNDATLEETARSLVALGVNGSDEAATYMASLLTRYNSLQRSKANTARDKMLIKQLLSSMQTAKNPLVKNAILQAQYIDYDNGLLRQMEDVLKALP